MPLRLNSTTSKPAGPTSSENEDFSLDINGVTCAMDLRGGGDSVITEQVTPDGPQAQVILKCFWEDRWKLIKALMGSNTLDNSNTIQRKIPFAYPSREGLFCTAIPEIRGLKPYRDDMGDVTGMPGWMAYEFAYLTAIFSKPSYQVVEDDSPQDNDLSGKTFITTRIQESGETLSPQGGTYFFTEGSQSGQPVKDTNIGLIYTRFEITMTRHFMPVVPIWDTLACLGRTNLNGFDLTIGTFLPGTVLFAGLHIEPRAEPSTGIVLWDVDYKFLANAANTWNTILDRDGKFSKINTDVSGNGAVPFPQVDFTRLLSDTIATGPDPAPGPEPA